MRPATVGGTYSSRHVREVLMCNDIRLYIDERGLDVAEHGE